MQKQKSPVSPANRKFSSSGRNGSSAMFARNTSDFDFSVQGGSFIVEKPKERFPVEDLIDYLTSHIAELEDEDCDLSDFEELSAEVLMVCHDPELLRVAKVHGWTGSRYYCTTDKPLDANSYLQALSNFYLKINAPIQPEFSNMFGKSENKGYDQIVPYCPDLLIDYFRTHPDKLKSSESYCITFNGACMLADISGFSKFSGAMCSKGVSGLDDLREATNGFLGHFVKTVYEYDGDVIEFAGDALVCVFPDTCGEKKEYVNPTDGSVSIVSDCCYRALQCACELRTHQAKSLSTHIGVSCGEMKVALLGGLQDQWVYLMNGKCVCDLAGCITDAGPQQVAASDECYRNAVDWVSAQRVDLPAFASIEVIQVTDDGNVLIDSMHDQRVVEGQTPVYILYERSNEKDTTMDKPLFDLVSCFVPKPVLLAVSSESLDQIGELRSVTTMFLSLDSYDPVLHQDPVALQPFFLMAQTALVESGGFLRQFLVDDKGCVFIAMWGTPSFTYSNNCSRALFCAASILEKCGALDHKVSIGITTGTVYCSTVGAFQRRDYAGIGTDVNMAARLMSKAHGRILLDSVTHNNLSQENKELLTCAETMTLKGMDKPMTPWQYQQTEDSKLPRMAGLDEAAGEQSTILKKRVKMCIADQLDKLSNNRSRELSMNTHADASDTKVAYFTLILGLPGTGKTVTAQYFRHHARKRNLQVVYIQARSEQKGLPYGLMRQLFVELVGSVNFATESQQRDMINLLVDQISNETHSSGDVLNMRHSLEVILGLEDSDLDDAASEELNVSNGRIDFGLLNLSDSDTRPSSNTKKKVTAAIFYNVLAVLLRNSPTVLVIENAHFCDELSWNQLQLIQNGSSLDIVVVLTMLSSGPVKTSKLPSFAEDSEASELESLTPLKMVTSDGSNRSGALPPLLLIDNMTSSSTTVSLTASQKLQGSGDDDDEKEASYEINLNQMLSFTSPPAAATTTAASLATDRAPSPVTLTLRAPSPVNNSRSSSPVNGVEFPTRPSLSTKKPVINSRPTLTSSSPSSATPRPSLASFGHKSTSGGRSHSSATVSSVSSDAAKYGLKYQPTAACIAVLENPKSITLEMTNLNESEIRAILLHTLKVTEVSKDLVMLVMDVCSGNAFWCKAIANFIKERDIEAFELTIKQDMSPQNALKVLVLCRMEKLKPGPQVILKHASIIGTDFSEKQLAAVVPGRYLSHLSSHLEFLCEHGFINCIEEFPEHKFSFQNQLIHDTIYELMPPKEAAALHLIVAEYLEVKYGDHLRPFYPQLGYHYSNSGPEARDMAFKFELKAADQALSRGAFSDGLVFTKASMKLAIELAELTVLVEVIEGAIAEMMANDASIKAASKPVGLLTAVGLSPATTTTAVNKTVIEYQKLKKDAELAIVKLRKAEAQDSHAAKIALLKGRSANEGLSWQPSFIASKRESSHTNLSQDDEDDEEEERGDEKKGSGNPWPGEVSVTCVEQPCCVVNCGCRVQCLEITCGKSPSQCCVIA